MHVALVNRANCSMNNAPQLIDLFANIAHKANKSPLVTPPESCLAKRVFATA